MTIGLAEQPSAGFTFSGWVGCASGLVTINGTTSCGATFSGSGTPPPPPPPGGGGGAGLLVITKPTGGTILGPGINCGDAGNVCSEALPNGMTIGLAEQPSAGFTFSGWVGCASGLATINGTTTCGATFSGSGALPPPPPGGGGVNELIIHNPGTGGGGGTVLAAGINCSPGDTGSCTLTLPSPGVPIGIDPVPFPGFVFGGWVEAGCSNLIVLTGTITCTANFNRIQ